MDKTKLIIMKLSAQEIKDLKIILIDSIELLRKEKDDKI